MSATGKDDEPGDEAMEAQTVDWSMLVPHGQRGGLFLLDEGLDIGDVAHAVAEDDSATIAGLLEGGRMRRPTEDELEADGDRRYLFVIVQPFVLAQGPLLD